MNRPNTASGKTGQPGLARREKLSQGDEKFQTGSKSVVFRALAINDVRTRFPDGTPS